VVNAPRYLDPVQKGRVIANWRALRAEPRPSGDLGGKGYPDPEMFPWTDRLNDLRWVCTLQSCAGHRAPDGHIWNGQLWLWLDEAASRTANARAFGLVAKHPLIEHMRRIYHDSGQEILDLVFMGGSALDRSMGEILSWLTSLRT
jgi:hypothetical protein